MQRSDQPGIIGVEADRHQIDIEVFRLQHDLGTRDRKLTHSALAKTATDHDALSLRPRLGLEEASCDISEFLRELLDRAVHDGRGLDVVADQHLVEHLLADLVGWLVAKGILAGLAQRLAPAVEDLAKGALAGAVAEKAVLVLQFEIEAVDVDRRQPTSPVAGDPGGGNEVLSHDFPGPKRMRRTTGMEPIGFMGANGE